LFLGPNEAAMALEHRFVRSRNFKMGPQNPVSEQCPNDKKQTQLAAVRPHRGLVVPWPRGGKSVGTVSVCQLVVPEASPWAQVPRFPSSWANHTPGSNVEEPHSQGRTGPESTFGLLYLDFLAGRSAQF